ncbi:Scarecrow-like protein 4 [Triticum urartu]|uniref:Scarecrow-like protein 4 n=1 Tax=Triticum urartu TaxID=4572 RepID=M8AGM4_TRIUA|nr:Scarecrow-like protein 4 [Triticum urartu]
MVMLKMLMEIALPKIGELVVMMMAMISSSRSKPLIYQKMGTGVLKAAEVEIKKEHQVLMVNKTTSCKKKGKGNKGNFKKNSKQVVAPEKKPKSGPKPETECFYCKETGHWKRNCPKYLAEKKDGKAHARVKRYETSDMYFAYKMEENSLEFFNHFHQGHTGLSKVPGIQWAALLQALATRPEGKPSRIRISGVPSPYLGPHPAASLAATSARLRDFAQLLGVDFEFVPLLRPVHALDRSDFSVDPDEVVAVNFMLQLYHLLGDSDEPGRRLLRLAKSLGPAVVTLGEYEVSLNRAGFVDRFASALSYYRAVFESLDVAMARDSEDRATLERSMFGERIRRAVGPPEGADRTDRMAGSAEWQALMEWCGFQPVRLSNYAESQAELLLWDYDAKYKYSLVQLPPAFLSLAWEKRPLLTVSAWR